MLLAQQTDKKTDDAILVAFLCHYAISYTAKYNVPFKSLICWCKNDHSIC